MWLFAHQIEHQPEKDPGDHPDLAGHQVGGVDQDGGECRGDDESDDDGEDVYKRQTQ